MFEAFFAVIYVAIIFGHVIMLCVWGWGVVQWGVLKRDAPYPEPGVRAFLQLFTYSGLR